MKESMLRENIEYVYQVVKMHRSINKKGFFNLVGLKKGDYYQKIFSNESGNIFEVPISVFMKIIELFNKYSDKKIEFDEFSSECLAEKYPPPEIFMLKEREHNIIQILKQARKISLRQVEKTSQRLFKDKDYHITATYLMRLERGDYISPSIKKLYALSVIYRVPLELIISPYSNVNYLNEIKRVGNFVVIDLKRVSDKEIIHKELDRLIADA